ncbi:MAG: hypothetical protein IKN89_06800 [Oscillospiraceae bacterium]|nr:hypothetical protein [Oscillospiraceae bacterium]
MRVLIWIAAILVLLAVFLILLRLRLTGEYGEAGGSLTVALGAVPVFRLPRPKGEKQEKKEKKPRPKKKKEDNKEKTKGGSIPGFRQLMPIISDALGKLKRRLSIDEMTLWYQSAAEDPASAALAFGGASAAAGALARPMQDMFRIKELDIRTAVSFTDTKPTVFARIRMSISVGALIWIGLRAYLKLRRAGKNRSRT